MATIPNFAASPVSALAQLTVANTNRDGTGTLVTVLTGPAASGSNTGGARVEEIVFTATATTTAGMIRLFINDGTNTRLWREVPVTAITPSGTTATWTSTMRNDTRPDLPLLTLPVGYSLRASTHNAETFNVIVTNGGAW